MFVLFLKDSYNGDDDWTDPGTSELTRSMDPASWEEWVQTSDWFPTKDIVFLGVSDWCPRFIERDS